MQKYKIFYFESYWFDYDKKLAYFEYSFDWELFFREEIDFFSSDFLVRKEIQNNIIDNILSHIHIALWISYYKFYPTEKLIVKTINLSKKSKDFWHKFYLNWLGEFFYTNKIDPTNLLKFSFEWNKKEKIDFKLSNKMLVPVWWGKDSIVSIELLKEMWQDFDLYTFWKDNVLYENTTKISGKKRLITKRFLSKNIKEVIDGWSYNWHVPITWIIAFNMLLVSYLYDYKYLVLSNEKSANFWNTNKYWININHQWSKSLEFEVDFSFYVSENISKDIKYFSLLRPFYEIQIAMFFSSLGKKYFKYFSSCNNNFKILNTNKPSDYWCLECPKCAFVYSILSAFLTKEELISIFWKDMYFDEKLIPLFRELLWIKDIKPFECVWESSEVIWAMKKAYKNYKDKLPPVLEMFKSEVDTKMTDNQYEEISKKLFDFSIEDSNIPSEIKILLAKSLQNVIK